ncbi:MAG: RNA chaperone ProQ [Thalassotalea sp.]
METKAITTKEIITVLAAKFPACFSIDGQAKPLKVGIFQEIAEQLTEEDNISKTRLRQALRHYTSSWRYLKSIKLGAHRVDLAGEKIAEIDKEQAEHAAKTLKESQEKFGHKPKGKKPAENDAKKSGDKKAHEKTQKQFKNVKSPKADNKAKPAPVKLTQVEESAVNVGAKVKVKFGNAPMEATITEVAGSDVHVQLASGMVVKTQIEKIFN